MHKSCCKASPSLVRFDAVAEIASSLPFHTFPRVISRTNLECGFFLPPVFAILNKETKHRDREMAAPKGNRFWLARSKSGRSKIFESPEDLKQACCEYFEWVEDNPLWEAKAFAFQGQVTVETLPKMRAMTKAGMCLFLDIAETTWDVYKTRKDFLDVVTWAENVIYTQKFSGAAADLLNPNIIARDLGLTDKQHTEHSGKIDHSDSELDRKLNELLQSVQAAKN